MRKNKLKKKTSIIYKFIKFSVWFFYPKTKIQGIKNLPKEPCIVVGNHAQLHGPVAGELYFPGDHYIWCASEMMDRKLVPEYAYQDFWSGKPKKVRWFYKIVAHLIAPLSECIFNNAHTIPVFRDKRVFDTFDMSIDILNKGGNIIIYPEKYDEYNNIVHEFQMGFADLAKRYYRKNKKTIAFVPMYVCPSLKRLVIGKPVYYNPEEKIQNEKVRICNYLKDEITKMAVKLPRHKVVPYPNIPKKEYGYNDRSL